MNANQVARASGMTYAVFSLLSVCAASCTQNKTLIRPPTGEYVWPAPPAEPRVRYVGEISGPLTGSNQQSKFQEFLFGPQPVDHLITPFAVAVHPTGSRVAISDSNAHCVRVLDLESNRCVRVDHAGATPLDAPIGVAWGGDLLFVSDPPRGAVDAFEIDESKATHVRTLAPGQLSRPTGLAYDDLRGLLYVCDSAQHRVVALDASGAIAKSIGAPGGNDGEFRFPVHVACSGDGSIAIADSMNFRVQRFSAEDGKFLGAFGRKGDAAGDLALPKGVAADASGNLWVVDAHFENVQAFSPQGQLLLALGREGHEPGQFWLPAGAFIDRKERLWIADTYNRRVQLFQLMP